MKRLALLTVISLIVTMGVAAKNKKKAQQPLKPMNEFVSELMGKMTVQEKIGQLNLLPSGEIQTGISENSSVSEAIRQGRLGAILNLKGVDNILKVQKMAVEESRLGIPLMGYSCHRAECPHSSQGSHCRWTLLDLQSDG